MLFEYQVLRVWPALTPSVRIKSNSMGKVWSKHEVRISTFHQSYTPGEEVAGTIALYLHAKVAKLRMELEVFGEEYFVIVKGQNQKRTFLTYKTTVFDQELSKGAYEFPYIFTLPTHLPNSFTAKNPSFSAGILYFLRVSIPQFHLACDAQFHLYTPLPPVPPFSLEETFNLSCCCFNSDYLRVIACLNQSEYSVSDKVLVRIGIDTLAASEGVLGVKIDVKQVTLLRTVTGSRYFTQIVMSFEVPKKLEAGEMYADGGMLEVVLPLDSTEIAGTTHGNIVESGVRVDVEVKTTGGRGLQLTLPLFVRPPHCPLPYSPPLPREWLPVVMPVFPIPH